MHYPYPRRYLGRRASPSWTSIARAGVIGFTKALAKEMSPSGIRVNCTAPGAIETNMSKELSDYDRQLIAVLISDMSWVKLCVTEHRAQGSSSRRACNNRDGSNTRGRRCASDPGHDVRFAVLTHESSAYHSMNTAEYQLGVSSWLLRVSKGRPNWCTVLKTSMPTL